MGGGYQPVHAFYRCWGINGGGRYFEGQVICVSTRHAIGCGQPAHINRLHMISLCCRTISEIDDINPQPKEACHEGV
jgi:hypothetical protein